MNKNREICCALVCAALLAVPELRAQDVVSLNLKQAVDRAVRNTRDVALAQARYNVAQNTVEVNRSGFRPSIFTGSGAGYTLAFFQTSGGARPAIRYGI